MRRLLLVVCLVPLCVTAPRLSAQATPDDSLRKELASHAYPLHGAGEALLLKEAQANAYFLLGELHGENEIPELMSDLWPHLWQERYRHVAAEVSPWAAMHLQRPLAEDATPVPGLWTRKQAADISRFAKSGEAVLWGCDMEEEQPDQLIRAMAQLNPADPRLQRMAEVTAHGYSRKQATELLRLAEDGHPAHDRSVGGASLWESTVQTLRVEALRSNAHTRYQASDARERGMKELFLRHFEHNPGGKVLLRFGRNHLHRGLDARGIATLGNFVAEWALAHGQSAVNVGVFAAGGTEHLAGENFSADERQDEPIFALLADLAGAQPTLFDLRNLRPILHAIPFPKRTALETNLLYWADSYDFLLCYPTVTPMSDLSADPVRKQ